MRVVIDLQGGQSISRNRGIGRYSLALTKAMAETAGRHETWLALSDAFPETIEQIRADFDALIPQERIVVWSPLRPVAEVNPDNSGRSRASEVVREAFLANLRPDFVHITSLFEGFSDDAVASIGAFTGGLETSVLIHDLIPLIHEQVYLTDPKVRRWYLRKIASLRRAGLWLANSESSRREGVDVLGLPPELTFNVSAAADPHFQITPLGDDARAKIRRRYGLARPFVMYTGGIDFRKNIDRLISAFARLPAALRRSHQLAIVCAASHDEKAHLIAHATEQGLGADEVILTGFIPEDDLIALYNLCKLFCFPSWHEGFGIPILEAMQCGAPVIGANRTSLPEVIGRADALFDPFSVEDISAHLSRALGDENYRKALQEHGQQQARKFSWRESARRAWDAFETVSEQRHAKNTDATPKSPLLPRPRLAYVSPLPPARSGIATSSAELIPELARHYDITLISNEIDDVDSRLASVFDTRDIEWFKENFSAFDRVLYQVGNSVFHGYMLKMLEDYPGAVELHDFFLSGIHANLEWHDRESRFFGRALYESHGYRTLQGAYASGAWDDAIEKFPVNFSVFRNAAGVVLHSNYASDLATSAYGLPGGGPEVEVVPLLRQAPHKIDRDAARQKLGFDESDFVVCNFGFVGRSKRNDALVHAWLDSRLGHDANCHLVFVGEAEGDFGDQMRQLIAGANAKGRISITGFASDELYAQHLCAADLAVQLRGYSRGESSGTVLDCMAFGLPTIVNANGAMAESPADCVLMLPDDFSPGELVGALEKMRDDPEFRMRLGQQARAYVISNRSPRAIADQLQGAIERFATTSGRGLQQRTLRQLGAMMAEDADEGALLPLARALDAALPARIAQRQLFLDLSRTIGGENSQDTQDRWRKVMLDLISDPPAGFRAEPLFISGAGARYARKFTLAALGCEPDLLDDDPVEAVQGDVYLRLDSCFDIDADAIEFYRQMRWRGVKLYFVIDDLQPVLAPHVFSDEFAPLRARRLEQVAEVADGFLCAARDVAEELTVWLEQKRPARLRPLKLGLLPAAFTVTNLSKTTGMKGDAAAARTSAASADPIENYISRGDWCAVWPKRHGVS